MKPSTVACLCATNRPEWLPFLRHQYEKQTWAAKELFIDDGDGLIPEKRTRLIRRAKEAGFGYIAWFDDDDWQNPMRLELSQVPPYTDAFGNVCSYFVSVESGMGIRYQAPEGIIFNGAVFRTEKCPDTFSRALHTGEDTDWLTRWHRRKPTYIIYGQPLQMWLCHRKNVTNRVETRSFHESPPALITEAEWRLVPR